jgi:CRISPR-associated protein Csb1
MTENKNAKPTETPNPPRTIKDFAAEFLADDAVAIIVRQQLLPDDTENPVIYPPTYLRAREKSQNDEKDDKDEKKEGKKEQQKAVYNIDSLGEGRNVCEIDSPQSDGNRSEPLFKAESLRHLVPQVVVSVNGKPCNILDAGHRAGDAVVRFSSLAAAFHAAFERAAAGDHSQLAALAPTSLLYGAWDSRSTQAKLQRIIKAGIRAENVKPLTRSATFIPPVDYVKTGAITEELDKGEGENNPLSAEGLKYALASQTLGGVRLTDPKLLVRTIKVNLVALRQLRAVAEPENAELSAHRTTALRRYILGLALVAATANPNLNLREGCNLRLIGEDRCNLVRHRKEDEAVAISRGEAVSFAEKAAREFFESMGIGFDKKDRLDARFEKGVAEEFLGLTDAKGKPSTSERDKVRALGPITRETLDKYWVERKKREKLGDPMEALHKLVEGLDFKGKEGRKQFKSNASKTNLGPKLTEIANDPSASEELKRIAAAIQELLTDDIGADTRKAQMLALFPSTPAAGVVAGTVTEAPAEGGQ